MKDDLRSVPAIDELARDPGRAVILPDKADEALLTHYAGGNPAELAQVERACANRISVRSSAFPGTSGQTPDGPSQPTSRMMEFQPWACPRPEGNR